jgi:acetyl esterase/lipase
MVAPSATWPTIEEDLVWACPDGVELRARLYRPSQPSLHPAPVLLDVHGGIWSSGDRTNDVAYCRPLAKQGFIVASVDFRQGPQSKHPAASIDVRNALRWVCLHAEEWGGAGATVGVIGTSSGAHLAMLAGIGYDAAGLDALPGRDTSWPWSRSRTRMRATSTPGALDGRASSKAPNRISGPPM